MVSVIIPVYNVKEYFHKCIESVANQTYSDIEIILVDDASTDASANYCDLWAENDKRVKVIHHSENRGHGEARNTGVEICKGEFLTFLDSDDWWELNFIEKMMEFAEQDNLDMVICDILYEYQGEKKYSELSEIRLEGGKICSAKKNRNIINTARTFLWGKLYKTEFYKSLLIKQPPLGFDDLAVVPYIVSQAEKIVRCPMPLYHYLRYREGNTVDNIDNLYGIKDALSILFDYFRASGTYEFYYSYLRKLAFSQVRFAIRKIGLARRESYANLINQLTDFMDKNFPGWFNPYKKKYAVVGDEEQAEIAGLIMFDDEQLHIADNVSDLEKYDYVFADIPKGISSQSQKWDIADGLFFKLCEGE